MLLFRLAVILCVFVSVKALAQLTPDDNPNYPAAKETVCFKYKFNPGDTLVYYVAAFDSIVIDYEAPLMRTRYEHILLVCDSVSKNGRFFISQMLINYFSKESRENIRDVERHTSPWLNRRVQYEMDSLGKRYSFRLDDSLKASMSTGGAFNPPLLQIIGEHCKHIGESWNVNTQFDLPENGIPVPLVRMSYLLRAGKPYDTLDSRCNKIEYISTGQGSFRLLTERENMKVTSILNGHGALSIDTAHNILVHHFSTVEQKLTIIVDDEITKPGLHFTNINYTLIDYKLSPPNLTEQENIKEQKNKKRR